MHNRREYEERYRRDHRNRGGFGRRHRGDFDDSDDDSHNYIRHMDQRMEIEHNYNTSDYAIDRCLE